jgi:micrococcal nuclease
MTDEFIRKATVTDVYDGDSITLDINLGFGVILSQQKFRLSRIDTPEKQSNNSKRVYASEKAVAIEIQEWLKSILIGKTVYIKSLSTTSFNRLVGEVWVDIDDRTMHVNQYMIDHGLAREYFTENNKDEKWCLKWFNAGAKDLYLEWKESNVDDHLIT